jgi:hypothetical protein
MRRATEINVEFEEETGVSLIHFITFEDCVRVKKTIKVDSPDPISIGRAKRALHRGGYNARAKDITI